jgi:hypothetical protein
MTLLADCGRSPSSCCRHVDISTVVHRHHQPSTICPRLPPCPSPGRTQFAEESSPGRARVRKFAAEAQVRSPSSCRLPGDAPCRDRCATSGRSPLVTWHTRDLPNLCTFLGTTHRSVDDGHRPHTDGYPVASALLRCRLVHMAVDSPRDDAVQPAGSVTASRCRRRPRRRRDCGEVAPPDGRPGRNFGEVAAYESFPTPIPSKPPLSANRGLGGGQPLGGCR